jgi:hypothetical protein
MTGDRALERAAREWIEAGPTQAPRSVVDDALRIVMTTGQERDFGRVWPRLRVTRPVRLVALATVLLGATVGGALLYAGTRSVPTPLPSPRPAVRIGPFSSSFASPTYGYAIAIGDDWTVTPATLHWSGPDNSGPVVDAFDVTGSDTTITAASEALADGQTLDDWLVPFAAFGTLPVGCRGGDPATWPAVAVGDATGRWQQMCNAAEVVVESGRRVYVFTWGNGTFDPSQHLSSKDFKELLRTVTFSPESVPPPDPAPALDARFTSPLHGYSIAYPAGWTVAPATTGWQPGTAPGYGDPANDDLHGETARLTISSQPLQPRESTEAWLTRYCQLYQPPGYDCEAAAATWRRTPMGPAMGWVDQDGVGGGFGGIVEDGRVFDAAVVVDGRAYAIALDGHVEQAMFDAMLASMTFDPALAVDPTPSP